MKKITFLAVLFIAAISYGQTPITSVGNADFEVNAGTGTADINGQNLSADGWKQKIVVKNGTTPAVAVAEIADGIGFAGSRAYHVKLTSAANGKSEVRVENTFKDVIAPVPSTELGETPFTFTLKFKAKFSGAIDNLFQVQTIFYDAAEVKQAYSAVLTESGGTNLVVGGGASTGKADLDATGLAIDTWHDIQVDWEFTTTADIELMTLSFNTGLIVDVDLYIDDVVVEIKADGSVLSTENITKDDASVFVYPNPVTNVLNYRAEGAKSIEVYNLLGQKILAEKAKGSINTSTLAKGLYILKLKGENGEVSTKRFSKK